MISVSYFEAFYYNECRSTQLDEITICTVERQLEIYQILSLNKARGRKSSRNCRVVLQELSADYCIAVSLKELVRHFGCVLYLTEKGYKPGAGDSSNPVPRK